MTDDPYDDEYEDDYPEPDCDCIDYDVDILTGEATCIVCRRHWYLGKEEFQQWCEFQAEWENGYYDLLIDEAQS